MATLPDIEPCPFCGQAFLTQSTPRSQVVVHPGQQADGSCVLAGFVFHGEERIKLLNKRPEAKPEE
jgi:hypothetical protein